MNSAFLMGGAQFWTNVEQGCKDAANIPTALTPTFLGGAMIAKEIAKGLESAAFPFMAAEVGAKNALARNHG
jgi:hypothetical protein